MVVLSWSYARCKRLRTILLILACSKYKTRGNWGEEGAATFTTAPSPSLALSPKSSRAFHVRGHLTKSVLMLQRFIQLLVNLITFLSYKTVLLTIQGRIIRWTVYKIPKSRYSLEETLSVTSSLGDLTQSVRPAMPDLRHKSEFSGLRTKLNRTKTEVQSLATRSRSP